MSGYRLLACKVCDTDIALEPGETFNRDTTRVGVFCDECWRWQSQIDALSVRVEKLEFRGIPITQKSKSRTCACGCGYTYLPGECGYGSQHGP